MRLRVADRAKAITTMRAGNGIAAALGTESEPEAIFLNRWRQLGGPEPLRQYVFHPGRRWRFDFAFLFPLRIAIEIEGGIFTNGAHVRGKHFLSDAEKYNTASLDDWELYRLAPQMFDEWIPKLVERCRERTDGA